MIKNKLQLFRIFFLAFATAALIFANGGLRFSLNNTAFAVGDLSVDWGTVNTGDPVFVVENMFPGQCESRTVEITNTAALNREVGVKGFPTEITNNLDSVLDLTIDKNSVNVYGPKTLQEFFATSENINGVSLSTQSPGESADYTFEICFQEQAGNEFQNSRVVFDLTIGIVSEVPAECEGINFSKTIFGTSGNDKIKGGSGNELIFGLEGNDQIDGGGGNDCIVAGDGNDKIDSGSGNDVIDGGTGNDNIDAGSGNDTVFGSLGQDNIKGGSGADILHGGDGNDVLDGGSENDQLFGEDGNDTLKGGSGNDLLDGGAGQNNLNGESGTDTCSNWTSKTKCEP